jgi:hypothetical protein
MSSKSENPGLTAARRAAKAETGPPDAYRPPPSVFPGRRAKVLPGQLNLYGYEHAHDGEDNETVFDSGDEVEP